MLVPGKKASEGEKKEAGIEARARFPRGEAVRLTGRRPAPCVGPLAPAGLMNLRALDIAINAPHRR